MNAHVSSSVLLLLGPTLLACAPGPAPSIASGGAGEPASAPDSTSAPAAPAGGCPTTFSPADRIASMAGTSETELWAVGPGSTVFHFDGSTWSTECGLSSAPLRSVWASAPGDVWAVGDERVILHRTEAGWSREPDPSSGTAPFLRVWGAGGQLFVLSRDEVLRFDGAAWSQAGLADMDTLGFDFGQFREVWGTEPADVWLGAERGMLHWDGRIWAGSLAMPMVDLVASTWTGAPGDVWAVGMDLDHGGFAYQLTPAGWRLFPGTSLPSIQAVRGTAGGLFVTSDRTMLRWNGSGFDDLVAPAAPSGPPLVLGSADVYLPDAGGISHWNGAGWSRALALPAP